MNKANRTFVRNEEAVSPVIGVILMVAITVVLAAVVFVLVSNLGEGADANKPRVSFSKDEQGSAKGGILTVVSIDNGPIVIGDLVVGGTADCTSDLTSPVGTGGWDNPTTSDDLAAGDQLTCNTAGTITISHTPTDTLLYSGEFA